MKGDSYYASKLYYSPKPIPSMKAPILLGSVGEEADVAVPGVGCRQLVHCIVLLALLLVLGFRV